MNNSGMGSLEKRLRERRPEPPPPRFPLLGGVYTFPWYRESLRPWLYLTLLGLVLGGLLRLQALTWPFGSN